MHNYNPHLTISESTSGFDLISKKLIGKKCKISKYFLAKKINKNWENLQEFYSDKTN